MDAQDVKQKSTITDWQAALGAERLRIAARVLPVVIGVSLGFNVLYSVAYFQLGRPWQWGWATLSTAATGLLVMLAYVFARRGRLPVAVYLVVLGINIQTLIEPALIEGMITVGISTGFVAVMFARLLAGRAENRGVALISGIAILAGVGLAGFQVFELLPIPSWLQVVNGGMSLAAALVIAVMILDSRDARYEDSLAQADASATELNVHREVLEQRTLDLERRARYLEATATVARDAASVLEVRELLSRVVGLISEGFGFYHTGIFLLDSASEWAVLQAASSQGGQRMLARGHRLRVGEAGIVGYVTGRGEPRIALDVGADAVFFDNPDLPDTRSEVALPLQARGKVIGALDVQSTEPEAFGEEDVGVLQTLADQVAMAINNARLFQQAQESLEAERRAYGEISRQAWRELIQAHRKLGYSYSKSGVVSVSRHPSAAQPDARDSTASQTGKEGDDVPPAPMVTGAGDSAPPGDADAELVEELPELALAVKVRGQVIGAINAHKPDDAGEWGAEEVVLMEVLAEQLGLALESARLYRDTQRRAEYERLTGEIAAHMRETLDMDMVLQRAIREIGERLDIAEVEVRMASDEVMGR